ncbi:MAG: hypothetical protein JRD89_02505 [Deltaproteobacteria bacterium]|nr:hypothetical protein [Deltaproteobacteria bacterium]
MQILPRGQSVAVQHAAPSRHSRLRARRPRPDAATAGGVHASLQRALHIGIAERVGGMLHVLGTGVAQVDDPGLEPAGGLRRPRLDSPERGRCRWAAAAIVILVAQWDLPDVV